MTFVLVEADLSIKNVAVNKFILKIQTERVDNVIEFEEYRLSLDALEKDINELRDSL